MHSHHQYLPLLTSVPFWLVVRCANFISAIFERARTSGGHFQGGFLQKKNPRIFPPRCFLLASSWSMIPPDVVKTSFLLERFMNYDWIFGSCQIKWYYSSFMIYDDISHPNCLEGRRLLHHFSMSPKEISNLERRGVKKCQSKSREQTWEI